MPGSSSSGNIRPQSTATTSSPDSTSIMFKPISPSPPRGMRRTDGSTNKTPFETPDHRSTGPLWAGNSYRGTDLGYPGDMRIISLTALALILTGCTTAYWDRPGASLPVLAQES